MLKHIVSYQKHHFFSNFWYLCFYKQLIHLYDARKYSVGAFAELKLNQSAIEKSMHNKGFAPEVSLELSKTEWTSIQFNTSGKQVRII